ncbi:MAG TPA: hypothetical protein VJ994_05830 [Paracoccaceae bacterium]|nr:hypothetical protein [Paracoccaceae bacterium]
MTGDRMDRSRGVDAPRRETEASLRRGSASELAAALTAGECAAGEGEAEALIDRIGRRR